VGPKVASERGVTERTGSIPSISRRGYRTGKGNWASPKKKGFGETGMERRISQPEVTVTKK